MREVFKINMVDKVIIGIAILVILLIIFSNNTWMEKIISALAFLILYYIVLHYGKDYINDLGEILHNITSSLEISKILMTSMFIVFIIAIIMLPFIILQGSKPLLIAIDKGTFFNLLALLVTLLIYIFPVILIVIGILYNARVKDLTVIFATLSFLGVVITNGKKVYTWIRKRVSL